jgi:hypothetical protein
MTTDQLALWTELGPSTPATWSPAPPPDRPYSHMVVWRTCLLWELWDWTRQRGWQA